MMLRCQIRQLRLDVKSRVYRKLRRNSMPRCVAITIEGDPLDQHGLSEQLLSRFPCAIALPCPESGALCTSIVVAQCASARSKRTLYWLHCLGRTSSQSSTDQICTFLACPINQHGGTTWWNMRTKEWGGNRPTVAIHEMWPAETTVRRADYRWQTPVSCNKRIPKGSTTGFNMDNSACRG